MNIPSGPTAQLSHWAYATHFRDLPEEVRSETVTLLLDQLGGMLASSTLPSCAPVIEVVRAIDAKGPCTIVGQDFRTSVTHAALVNGCIGHGDEVDSTGQHGAGHYCATVIPAALTMAQYVDASGEALCRAVAIGSEVAARVQSAISRNDTRPQFAASIGAVIGGTVSAALLLGLDGDAIEHAIGLAACATSGLAVIHLEPLHQAKSLQHGRAALTGVLSALLARAGGHGPREVFTAENGFFHAFSGLPDAGYETTDRLGETFVMREVAYKRYPASGPNQAPIYALIQLMKSHGLRAEDLAQIEVSVSRGAFQSVMTNLHPSVHLPTLLELVAVHGDITFATLHDARYRDDPRLRQFRERTRIFVVPRPGAASRSERLNAELTVRTRDGSSLRAELRYPMMSKEDVAEKFRALASVHLTPARVAQLEVTLLGIVGLTNIQTLMQQLELQH